MAHDAARSLALAALLAAALGGCAKNPVAESSLEVGAGRVAGAVTPSQQDFAATAGDRVFFEGDSTELDAAAQSTLEKQARWLNQYSRLSFTVEGHADERGTREYNFALGARRAEVTKDYLIAHGVSAGRIHTISFGKERPVATCDDISCWSRNRRAATVLGGGGQS